MGSRKNTCVRKESISSGFAIFRAATKPLTFHIPLTFHSLRTKRVKITKPKRTFSLKLEPGFLGAYKMTAF